MKKTITFLLLVSAAAIVWAQSPPVSTSHLCDIVITGDFDSECIYDFKDEVTDEFPNLMIACKHSTVTYTAYANMGTATPVSYTWEVFGDSTHTASGNQVTVDWGSLEWGQVVVTVVGNNGDTCTESCRVKLIDIPVVGAVTVPNHTSDMVINVCEGGTIEFIDNSTAGNSDIAGYLWIYDNTQATTPNFTIENVLAPGTVTHRVYNNCGCYDEESYKIEILQGAELEIDCYGTVCENAIVTYRAISPSCSDYQWYTEGGTIIRGQGSATPTVQWDNPTDGYGVIGLDGFLCGQTVCPRVMSLKVPVIQDSLAIKGQTDVCVGEAVVYSLPLFGSTEYQWDISPLAGVDTSMKTRSNETRFVFSQDGTYTLSCRYRCDFLDCGPYDARELMIVVKPNLNITGGNEICLANPCNLQTSPSVSASWTAYDLANGNAVAATGSGTSFSHTFSHAGRYLITAWHPSYCTQASFVLEVKGPPPAPTVADLDPHNRHTACMYSGTALAGTPSEPNYSLVWHPACTTATPQWYSGDSVSILYQSEVCDVRVYNYDRVLQCLSADYYVHQMTEFEPAHLNIPPNITVCPGTVITWGDNEIPDQSSEGMLYEWSLEEFKQHCASVQGSHLSNNITLLINNITTPTTFYVNLRRTYCDNTHVDTMIYITVDNLSQTSPTITGPDNVCVHTNATYTGSGGNPSSYIWKIEGSGYTGASATHTFNHEGVRSVVLYSNSYTYCSNANYMTSSTKPVFVYPEPLVQGLEYDRMTHRINVVPSLSVTDYSFTWWYVQTVDSWPKYLTDTTNSIVAPMSMDSMGTYFCTVTDRVTGCSKTVSTFYQPEFEPPTNCNDMTFTSSYDYCSRILTLTASNYPSNVYWIVRGGPNEIIEQYAPNRHMVDIRLDDIGIYSVDAHSYGINSCYEGTYVKTMDFIPNFSFKPQCDRILIVNNSRYISPGQTVYLSVTNTCNNNTEIVSFPVSNSSYTYIPTPAPSGNCRYAFTLVGYGTNGNITPGCSLGSVSIGTPSLFPGASALSITSANTTPNEHKTCNNTPIKLTAHLGYKGSIQSTDWNFDDGSTIHMDNNYVYHTFWNNGYGYNITVSATDNYGCVKYASYNMTSATNPFYNLYNNPLSFSGNWECPHDNPKTITFTPHNPSLNHYTWWQLKDLTRISTGNDNTYNTYRADDYFAYVINNDYCQKEASLFVPFKNAPTAYIYAENFSCCTGNSIMLYGDQGPSSNHMSYSWTITGPNSFSQTSADPNVVFTAPDGTGTYNVSLTVTDSNTTCSSTATETITVNARPAAPTLAFSGSPCISVAPVNIVASGFTGEMHWSNGQTGSSANYYTHGKAMAYYFDPSIGCASDTATIRIDKQPDFNAMLTGCYTKCYGIFDYNLPVWGLTDDSQVITWGWEREGNTIATGGGNYTYSPLLLPLQGFGNYQLHVTYGGGSCTEDSPLLNIDEKELCDCDSISVTCAMDTLLKDCKLSYRVYVSICNDRQNRTFCPGRIETILEDTTIRVISNSFTSTSIAPGNCYSFFMDIEVLQLSPSVATFRLTDLLCSACDMMFSVDIMPKTECASAMTVDDLIINGSLTSTAAGYFNFSCDVDPAETVLVFWSEPPMVIDYYFDGANNVLGLGMIDAALLSQLLYQNSDVCFNAITCFKDELCMRQVCFPASMLQSMIRSYLSGNEPGKGKEVNNKESNRQPQPALVPNPAKDEVSVVGVQGDITEIVVMDMNGRQLSVFDRTSTIKVSTLAAGSYIVRVKSEGNDGRDSVTYLKLIKE